MPDAKDTLPMTDSTPLDEIFNALDASQPARALEIARQALAEAGEEDPVLQFLTGVALLELERPFDAITCLQAAVSIDADDAEYHSALAVALFRLCRFEEARSVALQAISLDANLAEGYWTLALLAERAGDTAQAALYFNSATTLDGERYRLPTPLSREDFERHVTTAIDHLPEEVRHCLDRVAITVEDLPSTRILTSEEPPMDAESLLGLFVGLPLADQDQGGPGELPPRILIFKNNLERLAGNTAELIAEIAVTLYHELGHYLGLDESELRELDLD
jgi:predicted Zn-dependent protease with MMP-like domain